MLFVSDKLLDDDAENLKEVFVIIDGLSVPFPVEELILRTDTSAQLKLEFIDDQTKASELIGCDVYAYMVDDDPDTESEPLIGFTVQDAVYGKIGVIRQMEDYNGNVVIQVTDGDKETLISLFPELITAVDDDAKILYIAAPDGYFE